MNTNDLDILCNKIVRIIGDPDALNSTATKDMLRTYYKESGILYRYFHSPDGAMQFPVKFTEDEKHTEKILYQAKTIHEIINNRNYTHILELGCGMGFNTNYLSQQNPHKHFTAIDLEKSNIIFAAKKSRKNKNVSFIKMNYEEITLTPKKYDLIFAVETLCYSKNLINLLNNLSKLLTEHGSIIIFDGYVRPASTPLLNKQEQKAYKLLTWGWALGEFQKIEDLMRPNSIWCLEIKEVTELTENIMDPAMVYQKSAINALRYPLLLKILLKIKLFRITYIRQLCALLFVGYFLKSGYLGYYKIEFRKAYR